ncbi:aldo/keto reductase [Streptomyces sp. NPDC046994]|uniref:aldo/keto reductase n=1 Tax=Streptomyces sp. NPDC046994 TaxID=3155735 RepID=UPI0034513D49
MKQRTIGGQAVSAMGPDGMPLSITPEARRSIATIHTALDAGVTLIDTADVAHRDAGEVRHNEALIAVALRAFDQSPNDVLNATKGAACGPATTAGRRVAIRPVSSRPRRSRRRAWASR